MSDSVTPKRIVDKDFAKRLALACDGNSHCPPSHGRQKWVRDQIQNRFRIHLSPEGVRKWFSGESRPRPDMMRLLAQALEVDEAWLSLGINPGQSPKDENRRNALASGAVNLVAGMIQMAGGHIAFPNGESKADIQAIVRGKAYVIQVKTVRPFENDTTRVAVDTGHEEAIVIAVLPDARPSQLRYLRLTPEVIKQGKRKGGFVELEIKRDGQHFFAGDAVVPVIRSFEDIAKAA